MLFVDRNFVLSVKPLIREHDMLVSSCHLMGIGKFLFNPLDVQPTSKTRQWQRTNTKSLGLLLKGGHEEDELGQ